MNCAVSKVNDFFLVLQRPGCAGLALRVPGVGGCAGIADGDHRGESLIVDRAREAAVALSRIFAVPSGERQPDLDFDIGVAGGFYFGGDAAEGRKLFEQPRSRPTAKSKPSHPP